jgi:hypothetical protein
MYAFPVTDLAERLDALLELADIDEVILTRAGADNLVLVREPVWRGVQEGPAPAGQRPQCRTPAMQPAAIARRPVADQGHTMTPVWMSPLAREDLAWWRRHDRRVARELLHLMRRLRDGACIPPPARWACPALAGSLRGAPAGRAPARHRTRGGSGGDSPVSIPLLKHGRQADQYARHWLL